MADTTELRRLLSLVTFRPAVNVVEGLDAFRSRLQRDADGRVLRFLTRAMAGLDGRVRGGVAFVIAERYLKSADLAALRRLFATGDSDVKESVLNALWGEPPASGPRMGPGIVVLALEATRHAAPGVRAEACSVIQNQCAWGVDVSTALGPLLSLLGDPSGRVRMQAACAVGNLARRKYDLSQHVGPLRRNLRSPVHYVRTYSAWALWELSRSRHDIGAAVADLVRLLASRRDEDDDARKHAAGALLHHARKSDDNARRVKKCASRTDLDDSRKQVKRFQEQLAVLK